MSAAEVWPQFSTECGMSWLLWNSHGCYVNSVCCRK